MYGTINHPVMPMGMFRGIWWLQNGYSYISAGKSGAALLRAVFGDEFLTFAIGREVECCRAHFGSHLICAFLQTCGSWSTIDVVLKPKYSLFYFSLPMIWVCANSALFSTKEYAVSYYLRIFFSNAK